MTMATTQVRASAVADVVAHTAVSLELSTCLATHHKSSAMQGSRRKRPTRTNDDCAGLSGALKRGSITVSAESSAAHHAKPRSLSLPAVCNSKRERDWVRSSWVLATRGGCDHDQDRVSMRPPIRTTAVRSTWESPHIQQFARLTHQVCAQGPAALLLALARVVDGRRLAASAAAAAVGEAGVAAACCGRASVLAAAAAAHAILGCAGSHPPQQHHWHLALPRSQQPPEAADPVRCEHTRSCYTGY
jgi:hypothetical protein